MAGILGLIGLKDDSCFGNRACEINRDKEKALEQQKLDNETLIIKGSLGKDDKKPLTTILVVGAVLVVVVVGVIFALRKLK